MRKLILLFVILFTTQIGVFSQNKATDAAILKLMNVKRGMHSVNTLADSMAKNIKSDKTAEFKKEMAKYKAELIKTSIATFKKDYTAKEITAIYDECTSDKIDYTDLTNGFFRKWRQLKGNLYFKYSKELYFKYQ